MKPEEILFVYDKLDFSCGCNIDCFLSNLASVKEFASVVNIHVNVQDVLVQHLFYCTNKLCERFSCECSSNVKTYRNVWGFTIIVCNDCVVLAKDGRVIKKVSRKCFEDVIQSVSPSLR